MWQDCSHNIFPFKFPQPSPKIWDQPPFSICITYIAKLLFYQSPTCTNRHSDYTVWLKSGSVVTVLWVFYNSDYTVTVQSQSSYRAANYDGMWVLLCTVVLPYLSICSLPAFPNIWAVTGAGTMSCKEAMISTCLSIGLVLSVYCQKDNQNKNLCL